MRLKLLVYRKYGHELTPPVNEDVETGLKLHQIRGQALHEILDDQPGLEVIHWGDTHDTSPHEWVEVLIEFSETLLNDLVILPTVKYMIEEMTGVPIDENIKKAVSWFLTITKRKQDENKIAESQFTLPNKAVVKKEKPEDGGKIGYSVDGLHHNYMYISDSTGI